MVSVVGVRFRNAGKLYYFTPGELSPAAGQAVIVETARGLEYGEVITGVSEVPEEAVTPPLRPVIRIASAEDAAHHADNVAREKDAMKVCREKIAEHQLQMKLVGCEYTFDNNKILFYFTADKRVDFRMLVKDLAGAFHTRIELRQIGVRDEARMMGGLGICGRPLCCSRFLGDFKSVSIKMAKEQNLSLNPTKISGACGRLMCCLQYEEEFYEKVSRELPRVGRGVHTPDGDGTVVEVSVLKERVKVRMPKGNDEFEVREYPAADVQRMSGGAKPAAKPEAAAPLDEDAPDPAIMHALMASEMDVPDEDSGVPLPQDDEQEEQPAQEPPRRANRPPRPQRPRRGQEPREEAGNKDEAKPREDGRQNRPAGQPRSGQKRGRQPSAPQKDGRKEGPNQKEAPKDRPNPKEDPKEKDNAQRPAPWQAPKRDPWTVPEEFRQKRDRQAQDPESAPQS